jgi:hypothetical protein
VQSTACAAIKLALIELSVKLLATNCSGTWRATRSNNKTSMISNACVSNRYNIDM